MKQEKGWLRRWMDAGDLGGESLPGIPVLELAGDRRVLIENHLAVTEYGQEKISVRVNYGSICICGGCLELRQMHRGQLVITGRIDGISLVRRKR